MPSVSAHAVASRTAPTTKQFLRHIFANYKIFVHIRQLTKDKPEILDNYFNK